MTHNGGTVGVNLWFTSLSSDYPFMNLLKSSAGTNPIDNVTPIDPSKHDSNGYMHTVYGSGRYTLIVIPKISERPGNYVVKWDGAGSIYSPWTTTVSGSLTTAGATGRAVLELGINAQNGIVSLGVSAVGTPGTDYPHNIRFCHVDDEAALDLDPYAFGTKYLQVLADAKINTIRFMDSMTTNFSTWRNWAERRPIDYMHYDGSYYASSLYAGITTNSGDNYTVAKSGFTLTDGVQVIVKFNYTALGDDITINVESTGVIRISNAFGGLITPSYRPAIDRVAILTYSSLMNRYMMEGGNASSNSGVTCGWPIEMMVKLCNELNCHPWVCIPHLAFEPESTLATEIATYMQTNLNVGLIPKFEPSNEVWNNGFGQTQFAYLKQGARDATVFKGDWTTATSYSVGDGVFNIIYDGRYISFICKVAHTSSSTYNPGNSPLWVTATAYVAGDTVRWTIGDMQSYVCISDHTSSGSFITDMYVDGKWALAWEFQFSAHQWMGRAASILGKAVSAVYSDDRSKYSALTSFQMYGGVVGNVLGRLNSESYVDETGNAGDAAKFWVTHIAGALYVLPTDIDTATETAYIAEYPTATEARKKELIDAFASGESLGGNGQAWTNALPYIDNFSALAASLGIAPTLYEGGYEALVTGSADKQAFRKASKFSDTLNALTKKRIGYLVSKNYEFPCWYAFSTTETWGLIAPTIYNTETGSWKGISDYNNGIMGFISGKAFGLQF